MQKWLNSREERARESVGMGKTQYERVRGPFFPSVQRLGGGAGGRNGANLADRDRKFGGSRSSF